MSQTVALENLRYYVSIPEVLIRLFFSMRWLGYPDQSPHTGFSLCEMTQLPKPVISFGLFFCVRWLSNQDYPKQSSHPGIPTLWGDSAVKPVISFGIVSLWDDSAVTFCACHSTNSPDTVQILRISRKSPVIPQIPLTYHKNYQYIGGQRPLRTL